MPIAIIAAAGSGTRLGLDRPKALVPVADFPIVHYSLTTFARSSDIDCIVICTPPHPQYNQLFHSSVYPFQQQFPDKKIIMVAGGKERGNSIAQALNALVDFPVVDTDLILVHDAARPFISAEVITNIIHNLKSGHHAVIPVLPAIDTMKIINSAGIVAYTLPRKQLVRVQTPQGFDYKTLKDAYQKYDPGKFTDDASMVEASGIPVFTVPGSELLRKVTTPEDLAWAKDYVFKKKHLYSV